MDLTIQYISPICYTANDFFTNLCMTEKEDAHSSSVEVMFTYHVVINEKFDPKALERFLAQQFGCSLEHSPLPRPLRAPPQLGPCSMAVHIHSQACCSFVCVNLF